MSCLFWIQTEAALYCIVDDYDKSTPCLSEAQFGELRICVFVFLSLILIPTKGEEEVAKALKC